MCLKFLKFCPSLPLAVVPRLRYALEKWYPDGGTVPYQDAWVSQPYLSFL